MNSLLRTILSFFIVISFARTGITAQEWKMDPAHTNLNFSVRHFVTPVPGKFTDFIGTIKFDKKDLAGSVIDLTVQVNSVDTGIADRDNHLRSPDFFEAQRYPTMRYVTEFIKDTGNNTYEAHGKMTIKNVTRDLVLNLEVFGEQDHPFPNMKCIVVSGLVGKTSLQRLDYNVGTGKFFETGVVGNDVEISLFTELHRQKPGCK